MSPSPVYGARLLSGLRVTPSRGFKSRHLRPTVPLDATSAALPFPLTPPPRSDILLTMLGELKRDRVAERRAATRREILDAAWAIAREQGLAAITLRDVANRVGMQAPSLYSHFDSKNAIYDAMFGQAWSDYRAVTVAATERLPRQPRRALKLMARLFFDFAVGDLPRFQLMNQRTIPGFVPSEDAYAPAVDVLDRFGREMRGFGVSRSSDLDLCVAIIGGLIDAQHANDPGGDRWSRLLDRAMDMFADSVGLPATNAGRKK